MRSSATVPGINNVVAVCSIMARSAEGVFCTLTGLYSSIADPSPGAWQAPSRAPVLRLGFSHLDIEKACKNDRSLSYTFQCGTLDRLLKLAFRARRSEVPVDVWCTPAGLSMPH